MALWNFDVIVIGAGHAGCESALASARMGLKTLLLTTNLDTIAQMPCNPAIGGIGKGQLVREIDALGGEMGKAIDTCGIHFRMLNTSKGPAVQSPRAQADKKLYQIYFKKVLEAQKNLFLRQDVVEEIIVKDDRVVGVKSKLGIFYESSAVIVTTGTFLRGLIHIGKYQVSGGRAGEPSAETLSKSLTSLGFKLGRLKTGTPPRINAKSLNYSKLEIQKPDHTPLPFSFQTEKISTPQIDCFLTWTNEKTHSIVRANLDKAPIYSGQIASVGPRYCPSFETKVVRFPEKLKHQIYLEPEGLDTNEVYCNGVSTSLPWDVQEEFIHTIPGLEDCEIIRYGYAIEYDYAPSFQLKPTLETKRIENLYFAGQINGTSGYEEASAQGLIAGINAALKLQNKKPLILKRSEAYIAVMIDDLANLSLDEPYRMFTSRAEYRLLLRHSNADRRLMKYGFSCGLIHYDVFQKTLEKENSIQKIISYLSRKFVNGTNLLKFLRQPEVPFEKLENIDTQLKSMNIKQDLKREIETEVKYEGYIKKQMEEVEKIKRLDEKVLPKDLDYFSLQHLRYEAKEKLSQIRPLTLGQASRIPGISPADISVLLIHLGKN